MTQFEDMQEKRDEISRKIKEQYEKNKAKVHASRSWLSWRRMTPGQRTAWVAGVVLVVAVIVGLALR